MRNLTNAWHRCGLRHLRKPPHDYSYESHLSLVTFDRFVALARTHKPNAPAVQLQNLLERLPAEVADDESAAA